MGFAINEQGTTQLRYEDSKRILQQAFKAWSDTPCERGGAASITFSPQDDVPCHTSEYNSTKPNVNVVLFQDNDWKYDNIDGTLAKTTVTFNQDTGEIYDADIEVNAAENGLTISDDPSKINYDLLAIVTHEVGHFVGLAHSPDPTASMFKSYPPGSTTQRTVSTDDAAAICAAYPPGRAATCDATPRNGFGGTCDAPGGGTCAAAARSDETHPGDSQNAAFAFAPVALALAAALRRKARAA